MIKKTIIYLTEKCIEGIFLPYLVITVNIKRYSSRKYCLYRKELYIIVCDKLPLPVRFYNLFIPEDERAQTFILLCKPKIKILLPKVKKGIEVFSDEDEPEITMLEGDFKTLRLMYE